MKSLMIGFCAPATVPAEFVGSIIRTMAEDAAGPNCIQGRVRGFRSGPNIEHVRNDIVSIFLDGPADWLLFVDSDMVWEPDAVWRLLDVADEEERPIVCGLYFRIGEGQRILPAMWDLQSRLIDRWDEGLVRVGHTGAGFLMVHRRVWERLGPNPFARDDSPGEDTAFFRRVARAGIPAYVDTRVEVGHAKTYVIGGRDYRQT